jgi:hypothetical protein
MYITEDKSQLGKEVEPVYYLPDKPRGQQVATAAWPSWHPPFYSDHLRCMDLHPGAFTLPGYFLCVCVGGGEVKPKRQWSVSILTLWDFTHNLRIQRYLDQGSASPT